MQYQSLEEETDMKLLEERIQRDGIVREGNVLKVDSSMFLWCLPKSP